MKQRTKNIVSLILLSSSLIAMAGCNQSKGNDDWEVYMRSHQCKHVDQDIETRITRIKNLEKFLPPIKINWTENESFCKEWEKAYNACVKALQDAQDILEKYKNSKA